jgi:DNA-binding NtrC family response regulator
VKTFPGLRRPLALRGELGGACRTYLLSPGLNRIGSRLDGDVVLAHPGVSRRHALLSIDPGRLSLEDLGSKNGTFVNGARVESGRVEVGDRLRFGPVALRLEELDAPDSELAIPLVGTRDRERPAPETTQAVWNEPGPAWNGGLALLAAFVEKLPRAPGESPAEALSFLVDQLGACGAALLESAQDGLPVILSCHGMPLSEEALAAPFRDEPSVDQVAFARLADEGRTPRALVVWGDVLDRVGCEPFLPLVLRLLDLALRPEPPSARVSQRRRLVVPEGWVRGESPAMRALLSQMEAIAAADLPILILGETGAGKEGVARTLHTSSPRRGGPFIAINCAAIPRDLLEAELFGVGRGVATGVSPRPGRLQAADRGTLLLDEIGDMPAELQAKLLRALETKEIQPLGGASAAVDVRILAATNAGLEERVQEGTFRSDLFYRLAGYVLRVPPLRERREDIPLLVEHFLRSAARQAGKSIRGVSVAALQRLVESPWPGNVRQLEHVVRRLVWLCADSEAIVAETLDLAGLPDGSEKAAPDLSETFDLAKLERRVVAEALQRCGGNQSRAAELLGITRTSLYRRQRRKYLPRGSACATLRGSVQPRP